MATPGFKVTGFTPGQIICNSSDEAFISPGETEKIEMEVEQKAPNQTISKERREGFRYPGIDMNDGEKTPVLDDEPIFNSGWEDNTEKNLKERKARHKLYTRDQSAVEYSKSLLNEGDTLVYISYPGGIAFYDSAGITQPYKNYRVSSEKLKALGSPKFSRMFEERPQYWARKRKGLLHHLPDGIKYVLDLTPSEEGDEAVYLVTELSCSAGIRNWYLAEKRCGVYKHLVAGDDEVPGPGYIPAKTAEQLRLKISVDDYAGLASSPLNPTTKSASNEGFDRASLGRRVYLPGYSFRNGVEDAEIQTAIKNSLEGHSFVEIPVKSPVIGSCREFSQIDVKQVLDYCPIRHRFGVENLLRIIQGKVPKLDSAPKVWTLFVLAKYYECTNVVVDYITSWIMTEGNIKFLETLPEASLNIGLGLKIPMITRAAFSILVSEEALNVASRTLCKNNIDRQGVHQHVRPREKLDEDLWNVIQHASQDFCDRIQKTITDLLDERMAWFLELPEYRKICKFEDYCYKKKDKSKKEEALYERRKSIIQKLLINLRGYVRGRIVICLNEELSHSELIAANNHQREVQWEIPDAGPQGPPDSYRIYKGLGDHERVLLPYFWRSLRILNWYDDPMDSTRLPTCIPQMLRSEKLLVDRYGICSTNISVLETCVKQFNKEVNFAVNKENYHLSSPSKLVPTIPAPKSRSMDEERPDYTFLSAYHQDHAHHQARLAGVRALALELAGFDEKADEVALMSSVTTDASTKPPIDLPLRPKADEISCKHGKFEFESGTEPGPSTQARIGLDDSASKLLDNFLENFGHKNSAYKTKPIVKTSDLGLEIDSPLLPTGFPFADTSKPFSLNPDPSPNHLVEASPHDFSLSNFLGELKAYIENICGSMLSRPEVSEFTMLTDTLLCLTDNEWQYLPLWAGGNDDGSGGVTSADVPPAYYSNVGGLTPGVQYKGVAGFVGVGGSVNTSLDVRDGSTRTVTMTGSDVADEVRSETGVASDSDSDSGSVFSSESYDIVITTPTGRESESEFEIVGRGEDEESGDDFTIAGDIVGDSKISDVEMIGDHEEKKEKGKGKENENEGVEDDDMDWTDQEESDDDWEGSFTDD